MMLGVRANEDEQRQGCKRKMYARRVGLLLRPEGACVLRRLAAAPLVTN